MSPQRNRYVYADEFDGNLLKEGELVPARVKTNLRVMRNEEARQAWIHRLPLGVPEYRFLGSLTSPEQPSLEAAGRHYFAF